TPTATSETYTLSLHDALPISEAKEFNWWVNHEVLPAIRKTGGGYVSSSSEGFCSAWSRFFRKKSSGNCSRVPSGCVRNTPCSWMCVHPGRASRNLGGLITVMSASGLGLAKPRSL